MEQPMEQLRGADSTTFGRLATIANWIEQSVNVDQSTSSSGKQCRKGVKLSEKRDKISTNRLGGHYSTGRPLPMEIRERIVDLSRSGLKPCQISKELRVSHGCVSKLLAKWRKTGTVRPEKIGGSRPKKVLPSVARAITVYKHYKPRLQSWQIKEYLIKDGVCTDGNVPSISSINKTLRNHKKAKNGPNACKSVHKNNILHVDDSSDEVKVISVHQPATTVTKSASACLAHQSSTKAQLAQRLEAKAALMASHQQHQQQQQNQQLQSSGLDDAAQLWLYGKPCDVTPGFDQQQALPVDNAHFQTGEFYCPQQAQSYLTVTDNGAGLAHNDRLVSLQPHQQQQVFTLDGLAMYHHQQQQQQSLAEPAYQMVHPHQAYQQQHHPSMTFAYGDAQNIATTAVEVSQLSGFFDDVFV